MYRNCIADLQLHVDDIDEEYIRQSKAILISGTALAEVLREKLRSKQ